MTADLGHSPTPFVVTQAVREIRSKSRTSCRIGAGSDSPAVSNQTKRHVRLPRSKTTAEWDGSASRDMSNVPDGQRGALSGQEIAEESRRSSGGRAGHNMGGSDSAGSPIMPSAAPVRHLLSGCSHSSHDREDLDRSDASKQSTATAAACPDCDGSGPCDGNGAHVTGATPGTFSHSGGAWATNRHALESCGWDSDSVGAPGLSRAGSGGSLAFSSGSWDQYAAMDDLHPGDESPDAAAVRHQARMLVSEQVLPPSPPTLGTPYTRA